LIGTVVKKDLSEDLVYRMVKAAFDGMDEQVAAYPSIKGTNLAELTLETCTVPLHPGAVKYYREIGLKVPDNLIPK
jgi:uncharacterized protein